MISQNEINTLIKILKRAHINQLFSIFDYMIKIIFKEKLDNLSYFEFLKSINRL